MTHTHELSVPWYGSASYMTHGPHMGIVLTHKGIRADQEMHLGSRANLFDSILRRLGQLHSILVSN